MILTCDGEVFFATHSIESYLGFHQVSLDLCFDFCAPFFANVFYKMWSCYVAHQMTEIFQILRTADQLATTTRTKFTIILQQQQQHRIAVVVHRFLSNF